MAAMLTVKDAAGRLGVPVNTVYKLISTHQLAHYRIGRSVRIADTDLTEYVGRCYHPVQQPAAIPREAIQAAKADNPTMKGPQARRYARAAMATYGEGYTGLDCLKR